MGAPPAEPPSDGPAPAGPVLGEHLAVTPDALERSGAADPRARFAHVDTWVFDLDNTLYPPHSDLWPKIDDRMTVFMCHLFGLDGMSTRALQKYYYQKHGTTLRGLIDDYGLDPQTFLDFVHDIDRSSIEPNLTLAGAIAALPGRRLILTNGSRDHALRTCERLGFARSVRGRVRHRRRQPPAQASRAGVHAVLRAPRRRPGARRHVRGHRAQSPRAP